jgi:two-component system, NtrC family, response regulator AtoC
MHDRSARKTRALVKINCAAISAGLVESELFGHVKGAFTGAIERRVGRFELADRATLFLDEVGELPLDTQVKLLRVLQERRFRRLGGKNEQSVDVRVIAATNIDPAEAVQKGKLREDLYYRLNVFQIEVPPLRERREDVRPLFESFLRRFTTELGKSGLHLATDAGTALESYDWPGNVRELQNTVERAVVLCPGQTIDGAFLRSLLPAAAQPAADEPPLDAGGLEGAVSQLERKLILRALGESGDNKAEAARRLGVSERTLWYKLKKYRL